MISITKLVFYIGLILTSFLSCSISNLGHANSCDNIKHSLLETEITKEDAIELYNNDECYFEVLKNIATGSEKWLDVGLALYKYSDAGFSEQLNYAFGEALGSNAEGVLLRITDQEILLFVCSGPDGDDDKFDSFQNSYAELTKRVTAVQKIQNLGIEDIKNKCLETLNKSIIDLRQYYTK